MNINQAYSIIESLINGGSFDFGNYTYLIGGTVLSDISDNHTNDIDLMFYCKSPFFDEEYISGLKKNFETTFSGPRSESIDLVPEVDTDYYSDGDITLTDYIFGENRDSLTQKLGLIRIINLKALFLMKLPLVSKNERHLNALKLIYKTKFKNELPEVVAQAIDRFDLKSLYDFFIKQVN